MPSSLGSMTRLLFPTAADPVVNDVGPRTTGAAHGANGNTSTESFAELLPGIASGSLALADAVVLMKSDTVGFTTMVMTAAAPLVSGPIGQDTVPAANVQAGVLPADTNDTLAGSVCVATTLVAVVGPLLVTVTV